MEDVRDCCLHNGFFQITGHNVPLELQQSIMDWNKKFFDLSLEQKMEVSKGASLLLPSTQLLIVHSQTQQTHGTAATSSSSRRSSRKGPSPN